MSLKQFSSLDDFEPIDKTNRLGKGSFATVHKLRCVKDNKIYAVKEVF